MPLTAGIRLGSYEIVESIGAGGMGEVYRARDTTLGRDVAIKTLRPELAKDPERLRRFEQEARSASALNHPNIIHIYVVGEHEGTPYIAMEYVEGRTLRELLAEGAVRTSKLLDTATQIAAGLSKAHAAGIVHRDLKPENLIVTVDGYVKILDFGLAKLLPRLAESSQVDSEMVTRDQLETRQGVIVGTVQYMSPEQAKGSKVDALSDQFSLGSILYEMATGERAFERESFPQTMAAIIDDEPAPIRNPEVPTELNAIIERCLHKDPAKRFETTEELAKALKSVPETSSVRRDRRSFFWGAAGIVVVLVAVVVGLNRHLTVLDRSSPEIDSLVVLPLRNASGDPEQEYLADGMTEALITDLAKLGSLKVISRTSAMRYKGTGKSLGDIASELDVDAVIEGSTLRSGDRVRVTVQLVDLETEIARWSESYERDFGDLIALEGELARTVAREIQADLSPEQIERLARKSPVSPDVYEAVLRGRFHSSKLTRADFDTALGYFELALEKEPDYAPAYVGIAGVWISRSQMGFASSHEASPRADAAIRKALELDDTLAEAHRVLAARLTWQDWDWPAAEREWLRARELDPNNANAHRGYGHFLSIVGRSGEGLRSSERALELDPLNAMTMAFYGVSLSKAGRSDEAVARFEEALETSPRMPFAAMGLVGELHARGDHDAAFARLRFYRESLGDRIGVEALTRGYEEGGYSEALRRLAETLAARSLETGTGSYTVAQLYLFAGDRERTLDWLERCFENRDQNMPYIGWPEWRGLLGRQPRYQELLRRMNLAPL